MNSKALAICFSCLIALAAAAPQQQQQQQHRQQVYQQQDDYNTRGDYSGNTRGVGGGAYNLEAEEQDAADAARNAKYTFASAVDDGIMDHSHLRQESRENGKVSGQYSYSDGFFKRTVKYEADENGYRVVGEDVQPIGNGPQVNLNNGQAEVRTRFNDVNNQYTIRAEDIDFAKKKALPGRAIVEYDN